MCREGAGSQIGLISLSNVGSIPTPATLPQPIRPAPVFGEKSFGPGRTKIALADRELHVCKRGIPW